LDSINIHSKNIHSNNSQGRPQNLQGGIQRNSITEAKGGGTL
jgi:hypothetical protein